MKRIWTLALTLLLLTLAFSMSAFAGGYMDGRVVLGGEFVLNTGETLDGDLAVIGGIATLESGSRVTGTVFLVGGNLVADGTIGGDLAVVGGNARLGPEAVVEGDLVTFGGNVNRNGGRILGDTISGEELNFPYNWRFNTELPFRIANGIGTNYVGRVVGYLFQSFMLAALAVLVVMFLPKQVSLVSDTVVDQPIIAGAFGLLTIIVGPILIVFLLITICLAVVGLLGALVLVAAGVLGWIALGMEVGKRLSKAMNQDFQPVVAAGLGTLIFALVVNGIGFIPCVGWLAPFLASAVGLGAVLMTRFGTRPYGMVEVTEVPPTDAAEKPAPKKRSTSSRSTKSTKSTK
ncbi:MAG: hypothetical protein ACK2T2_09800 [Anaerolineales bacterium]|jgi:hypothetical protein